LPDGSEFFVVEQVGVGGKGGFGGIQQAPRVDLRLAQHAQLHVVGRGFDGLFQHGGHLGVAQAIRRLYFHVRFSARGLLACGYGEQTVCVDLERHANARRTCDCGRNAAQLEARERAAVRHAFAFTLHHVNRHGGLPVLERGEFLGACERQRRVARNDLFDKPTHGFDTERQRAHVE
jgi:hypothetical protein